jgi:Flp pilus assembly protein TadB
MPGRRAWTERTPGERRRSYLLFVILYLGGAVVAVVAGWTVPAVVLAVIGVLLAAMAAWNPKPRRR